MVQAISKGIKEAARSRLMNKKVCMGLQIAGLVVGGALTIVFGYGLYDSFFGSGGSTA